MAGNNHGATEFNSDKSPDPLRGGFFVGATQDEIARVFGVARSTVESWLSTTNDKSVNSCIPDARTKIGKGEVDRIMARVESGEPQTQIAVADDKFVTRSEFAMSWA